MSGAAEPVSMKGAQWQCGRQQPSNNKKCAGEGLGHSGCMATSHTKIAMLHRDTHLQLDRLWHTPRRSTALACSASSLGVGALDVLQVIQ